MADDAWDEQIRGPKMAAVKNPKRCIWKYQMPVLEDFYIDLPEGANIIRFASENGFLWLWADVTPSAPIKPIRLLAFKAGAEMPDIEMEYLGCAPIYVQAELMLYYYKPLQQD